MSDASDQAGAVLTGLFSSRVRLKVLQRLVAPPGARSHARDLAKQTGEHFNSVWQELKHLEELGVLRSRKVGNQVQYEADPAMPLLAELRSLLGKAAEAPPAAPAPAVQPAPPPPKPAPRPAKPSPGSLVMGETD